MTEDAYNVLSVINRITTGEELPKKSGMRQRAESRPDLLPEVDDANVKKWYDAWYTSAGAKSRALRLVSKMNPKDKDRYGLNTKTYKNKEKQYRVDNENANKLVYDALRNIQNAKGFDVGGKADGDKKIENWHKAASETGIDYPALVKGWTNDDYLDTYFVTPLSSSVEETATHELSHSSKLDVMNDRYNKPISGRVKSKVRAKYGDDVTLREGFLGSLSFYDKKTGLSVPDKEGVADEIRDTLFKDYGDFKYMQLRDEVYPRIMQLRRRFKLNPNGKVGKYDVDKMQKDSDYRQLKDWFSDEEIVEMFNIMVSNQKKQAHS